MWVKTHSGNFCNLSRATDITVAREPIAGIVEVHAYFEGSFAGRDGEVGPNRTLLASFGHDAEAERYMKGLGLLLKVAACNLRVEG